MKKIIKMIVPVIIILFAGIDLNSETIWKNKNIYSSKGNLRIGDIIVVKVTDISDMRFNLNLNSVTTSDLVSNPDINITGFLPKIASNRKMNYKNIIQVTEQGRLSISIASRIVKKGKGGTYVIAGSRTFSFNGAANRISISGIVDPELIEGRMLNSNNIAEFRIDIRGSREGMRIVRKKLKGKETADSKLTEDEKQKLIVDYLEKMINELKR